MCDCPWETCDCPPRVCANWKKVSCRDCWSYLVSVVVIAWGLFIIALVTVYLAFSVKLQMFS